MKLCLKCKHCLPSEVSQDPEYSRCGFERPISLVTGLPKSISDLPFCSGERGLNNRCSPLGEHWEALPDLMTEEEELLAGSPL